MHITKHMDKRMRQRGRNRQDLDLVRRFGTKISPEMIIMRQKDCAYAAKILESELPHTEYKQALQRLDHLNSYRLIRSGGNAVTGYHRRKKLARPRRKCWRPRRKC